MVTISDHPLFCFAIRVIARNEAIPNFTKRICKAPLPVGDCFVPRNDGLKIKKGQPIFRPS